MPTSHQFTISAWHHQAITWTNINLSSIHNKWPWASVTQCILRPLMGANHLTDTNHCKDWTWKVKYHKAHGKMKFLPGHFTLGKAPAVVSCSWWRGADTLTSAAVASRILCFNIDGDHQHQTTVAPEIQRGTYRLTSYLLIQTHSTSGWAWHTPLPDSLGQVKLPVRLVDLG